jgi:ferredoxin
MTTDNTTTAATNPTENIHRTPALDKMGLARCRKDNKLFSWRKGGSCKVCGARVEDGLAAPTTAPTAKPKRSRKAAAAAQAPGAAAPEPSAAADPAAPAQPSSEDTGKKTGSRSRKAKK